MPGNALVFMPPAISHRKNRGSNHKTRESNVKQTIYAANAPQRPGIEAGVGGIMSLPLKYEPNPAQSPDPLPSPEDLGPKIIAMESYDPELDLEDAASEEVEAVLRRASDAAHKASPLHEIAESLTCAYDEAIQNTLASARRGVNAIRALGERDPVRFVATVAAAAFVVGFLLRIGRSSRG